MTIIETLIILNIVFVFCLGGVIAYLYYKLMLLYTTFNIVNEALRKIADKPPKLPKQKDTMFG